MFILLIDVDDDTRCVVFNDLSLHDTPYIIKGSWINPNTIAEDVFEDISLLLPEKSLQTAWLPYLLGMFKKYKNTYRFLTNAHDSIFSTMAPPNLDLVNHNVKQP
jgi:hypothetical protein